MQVVVVDEFGDAGDEGGVGGVGFAGVHDEDGDGVVGAVGEEDEADVVVGYFHAVDAVGAASFVPDDGGGGEHAAEFVGAGGGGYHGVFKELLVGGREEVALQEAVDEEGGGGGAGMVEVDVFGGAVHEGFVGGNGDAGDAEAADVLLEGAGAADEAEEDVAGVVVAQGDGVFDEPADGKAEVAFGAGVAEGTVGVGQEVCLGDEEGGVERGAALVQLVEDCHRQGEFEGAEHGKADGVVDGKGFAAGGEHGYANGGVGIPDEVLDLALQCCGLRLHGEAGAKQE